MTYDTALNLVMVLAIPAVVLVSYRLFVISRRNSDRSEGLFVYEVEPETGEIGFADEKWIEGEVSAKHIKPQDVELDDMNISMVDVLMPEEEELARFTEVPGRDKMPEESEA